MCASLTHHVECLTQRVTQPTIELVRRGGERPRAVVDRRVLVRHRAVQAQGRDVREITLAERVAADLVELALQLGVDAVPGVLSRVAAELLDLDVRRGRMLLGTVELIGTRRGASRDQRNGHDVSEVLHSEAAS